MNLPAGKLRSLVSGMGYAARQVWLDIRRNRLGQTLPLRPETLNLLVNDICNSRCQMCLIWQQKREREITPAELAGLLRDPLFSRLSYIGVSGGEPTLRADLPEIFSVIINHRPRLRATGLITNAIQAEQVIERGGESLRRCREAGIPFNLQVSLDGIGQVHDQVRGRPGNFESALQVLDYFRGQPGVTLMAGCTITKDNVWHLDELLDFCQEQGIYIRFRVAEFIRRLYNHTQVQYIRNFDTLEQYHLGLFFTRLILTYEKDRLIQRTYQNLRAMLLGHAPRQIACPYQTSDVVLDSRAQLQYCAPKSPLLGDARERSARRIYLENIPVRKQILAEHCANCVHDYHAHETTRELIARWGEAAWRRVLGLRPALLAARYLRTARRPARAASAQTVLIIGWYGTETAGDKAILAALLNRFEKEYPQAKIKVASLYPFLTHQTLGELNRPEVEVVHVCSNEFWQASASADLVVMGGGPIMHIEELGYVLWSFLRANQAGHRTLIAGCGVGPLDRNKLYEQAAASLIGIAERVELRDSASLARAQRLTGRRDMLQTADPAEGYVKEWKASREPPVPDGYLALFLRAWSDEYKGALSTDEFDALRERFEAELGRVVRSLCKQHGLRPRLVAMHHFAVGGDDRQFNRRFARQHLDEMQPLLEEKPLTLNGVLTAMHSASLAVCMRFHSVLFAQILEVPYLAIDYTQGGKIHAFLEDRNRSERLVTIQAVSEGRWSNELAIRLPFGR